MADTMDVEIKPVEIDADSTSRLTSLAGINFIVFKYCY
jgi:hypothetical protein